MKVSQLLEPAKFEVERPFREKLARARDLIKLFTSLQPKHCGVSCSFGKDSMVVLSLVREVLPDVYVIFNNTGVQYPQTYRFRTKIQEEWNLNLFETKSLKTFWECAEEYGLPDGRKRVIVAVII